MFSRSLLRPLLLPWAFLSLLACGSSSLPEDEPQDPPNPTVLSVTWDAGLPEACYNGQAVLSVTITGGTPREVALFRGEVQVAKLTAPYQYTLDCTPFPEGMNSFVVKATTLNSQSFTSPEKSLLIDRTGPFPGGWREMSFFPALGERAEYRFTEPLHPLSLEGVQFRVRTSDGSSVAHQVSLSEDGQGLRVIPAQPLVPPVTLTVEFIRADVMDRSGNLRQGELVDTQPRSFTWWPFARVGELPATGFAQPPPHYAFSSNGHRALAWTESPNGSARSDIVVARWTGQGWERLPVLHAASDVAQPSNRVSMAVAEEGQIFLAWLEEDGTLLVKRFDGTEWQSVGNSPNPDGSSSYWLNLAVDTDGGLVVVWEDEGRLHVARWNGSFWGRLGGPISANPDDPHASKATLAVRPGLVVLAWVEWPMGAFRHAVHVWEHRDGKWSPLGQPLKVGPHFATQVTLALNAAEEPLVVWGENDETQTQGILYFSRFASQGGWATPEIVKDWTNPAWVYPIIRVDQNGAPWVAWQREGVAPATDVVYRRRGPNGWQPEQLVGRGYLVNFELDREGIPWVALTGGESPGLALTRPQ
ncbi:hypothetical protein [Stigmatella aurantiaca]|nr:hypothetical protein [Stigmatella aurantiaca]ADO69556.1 conserved uncharacterized protein [Stigmatella aurantiaca DW4/3-1]